MQGSGGATKGPVLIFSRRSNQPVGISEPARPMRDLSKPRRAVSEHQVQLPLRRLDHDRARLNLAVGGLVKQPVECGDYCIGLCRLGPGC